MRIGHKHPQLFRGGCQLGSVHFQHEGQEFLPAPAPQRVPRAKAVFKRGRNHLERFVADGVPVGVVDLLEVVDVGEKHTNAGSKLVALREATLYPQFQVATVPDPGEGILDDGGARFLDPLKGGHER